MKIFVGIPAYDHKVHVATMMSLLDEQYHARKQGHSLRFDGVVGNSLVQCARDQLVANFLETDCDTLFFLDADVAWERGALTTIATKREDFVGAAYPYKQEPIAFPVTWASDTITASESGLFEAATVPGGFLAVKRGVFKKLREAYPNREYERFGRKFYAYFHCPPGNGEDGTFCNEWRKIGGKVWIHTEALLSHWEAGREYKGRLGDWLRAKQ